MRWSHPEGYMVPSQIKLCKGNLQSMVYWIFILKVGHFG